MIGLSGAHRVGKTTLAKKIAESSRVTFIPTSVGEIQRELGYDSANQSYDFDTRMTIQEAVFERLDALYVKNKAKLVIFDRTPLDLIGYAMCAVNDSLTQEQSDRLERFIEKCYKSVADNFTFITVVQPGIPLVEDNDTSAKCCKAFIEKFNAIILGLLHDPRSGGRVSYLQRHVTDLDKRVNCIYEGISGLAALAILEQTQAQGKLQPATDQIGGVEISSNVRS